MYTKVISKFEGVEIINKYEFVCINAIDAVAVVECILRIGYKTNTRPVSTRAMQNALYTYGQKCGSGGYHDFHHTANWDSACGSVYDSFNADSNFIFELYARLRRIKLIVDNEQIGGALRDGITYLDADIKLTSCEGGWHIEVMYELVD